MSSLAEVITRHYHSLIVLKSATFIRNSSGDVKSRDSSLMFWSWTLHARRMLLASLHATLYIETIVIYIKARMTFSTMTIVIANMAA